MDNEHQTLTIEGDGTESLTVSIEEGGTILTVTDEHSVILEVEEEVSTLSVDSSNDLNLMLSSLSSSDDIQVMLDYYKGDKGEAGMSAFEEWKTLEGNEEKTFDDFLEFLSGLGGNGSGGGNANIHIGTEPPQNTTYMWIDTSVPFNLDVSTYEGRLRIKYIEMLNQVIEKINPLSEKINKIEENINKISSDNSVKINESKAQLSSIRAKITSLLSRVNETQFQLMNGGDLPLLKSAAKQLRKEMKQDILYSLADLNYNVMVILDSEVQFIQPDNPSTPNDPSIDVDNSTLLTEDGFMLLTEDGLVILIDGATSSDGIKDAILTELGQTILTEDGSIILIDGGTSSGGSSDILQGAILTEQGKVLLLENGKQLLKG